MITFCSEKRVFVSTFSPFCPVSFWSQLVYGRGRVETRFYLSPKNGSPLRHGRESSVGLPQSRRPPCAFDLQ